MAEYRGLIDGIEKNFLLDSFEIKEVANGVNIITVETPSTTLPLYRPEQFKVLTVEELSGSPAPKRFSGLISGLHEGALGSITEDPILTRIDAGDFSSYTERRFVSDTIPAGTMKAALIVLMTYLTPFGTTLDAGQVDGPALPEIIFDAQRVDECLNYVSNLTIESGTPYLWNIDYDNVLSMKPVGGEACPFDLIEGDGTEVGDIEVTSEQESGINTVTIVYGTPIVVTKVQDFVGDGVTDTFPLDYTIAGPIPFATSADAVGYAVVDINVHESLGGLTSPMIWKYDPAGPTIRRPGSPPTNLQAFSIRMDVQFPQKLTRSNLGSPPDPIWEKRVVATHIHDKAEAIIAADAELAKLQGTLKTAKFKTFQEGARPGQTLTITVPKRALSGTFLITEVVTRQLVPKGEVESVITAVGGDTFNGSFRDLYKAWLGGDVATGGSSVAVAGSGGVPGMPLWSQQYNLNGKLAGAKGLLYDGDGTGVTKFVDPGDPTKITRVRTKSSGDFEVLTVDGHIQLVSTKSVFLSTGAVDANAISLGALTMLYGMALNVAPTIASLPHTIDSVASDIYVTYPINATSGALTLPLLSSFRARPFSGDVFRVLILKNIHASGIAALTGNTADTIDGAATLDLGPNQATILHGSVGVWRVIVPPMSTSPSSVLTLLTADPSSPANDTWWFKRTGAGPYDISLNVRIAGATSTFDIGSTV